MAAPPGREDHALVTRVAGLLLLCCLTLGGFIALGVEDARYHRALRAHEES